MATIHRLDKHLLFLLFYVQTCFYVMFPDNQTEDFKIFVFLNFILLKKKDVLFTYFWHLTEKNFSGRAFSSSPQLYLRSYVYNPNKWKESHLTWKRLWRTKPELFKSKIRDGWKNALNCFRLLVFNIPHQGWNKLFFIFLFFTEKRDNSRQRTHTFDNDNSDANIAWTIHTHTYTEIWVDWLTAFNGVGCDLQGHCPPCGLIDVNAENHPHARVLASYICFSFPQLDVWVTQLEDPRAVNPVRWHREFDFSQTLLSFKHLSGQTGRPLRANWADLQYTKKSWASSRGGISHTQSGCSHVNRRLTPAPLTDL